MERKYTRYAAPLALATTFALSPMANAQDTQFAMPNVQEITLQTEWPEFNLPKQLNFIDKGIEYRLNPDVGVYGTGNYEKGLGVIGGVILHQGDDTEFRGAIDQKGQPNIGFKRRIHLPGVNTEFSGDVNTTGELTIGITGTW